jgi:DNA-binding MarR family transcriptional regulator
MRPDELEKRLQERLDALGPRAELLHVLILPDFDRSTGSTKSDSPARDGVDEHVERAIRESPEIDPSVEEIVGRIDKLSRYLLKSWAGALNRHHLSEGEYKVLVKLRLAGKPNELSPGELSRELMLSTVMTNRLDGLEKRGLVQRRPDPHDRRGILVGLTDRGQEVLAAAVRDQVVEEARLVSALGADEKHATSDLLRKFLLHSRS